jgi:hypothetical protein
MILNTEGITCPEWNKTIALNNLTSHYTKKYIFFVHVSIYNKSFGSKIIIQENHIVSNKGKSAEGFKNNN